MTNGPKGAWEKGLLVVVEGIDGTGKSTLVKMLEQALKRRGLDVASSFEPTNGPFGRRLRESFSATERLSPEEELKLFTEDRRQHVREFIAPALDAGKIVLLDRYYISTMAYQGARGLDPEDIRRQNEAFAPRPDIAFILELDPEDALRRISVKRGEAPNSFEALGYLKRVKAIFDSIDLPCIIRLNAAQPVEEVLEQALGIILSRLE